MLFEIKERKLLSTSVDKFLLRDGIIVYVNFIRDSEQEHWPPGILFLIILAEQTSQSREVPKQCTLNRTGNFTRIVCQRPRTNSMLGGTSV